jgi:GNAT superfamily N-acetyltransferase
MSTPNFDTKDFDFSFRVYEERGVAEVTHLNVNEDIRRNGYGSVILETLKRVALQNDNVHRIVVRIGGGEETVEFLRSNGFRITEKREYDDVSKNYFEGEFGVNAEYLEDWVSDDYQRDSNS